MGSIRFDAGPSLRRHEKRSGSSIGGQSVSRTAWVEKGGQGMGTAVFLLEIPEFSIKSLDEP